MRAAALCMGIGGLDLAVEAVYGCELAWCAEWEDAPSSVIERWWPGTPNYRDLTRIDWSEMEPVDVLTAGYPCQPFSHAGKRKGTDDPRHLWPHVAEAVRVLRPRRVVLENVAGHLSLGFDVVLGDLAEAGFDAEWCVLRASDVGACHQRARLFLVARDADRPRADAHAPSGAPRRGPGEPGGLAADASGTGAWRDGRALPGAAGGPRRPGEHVHAARDAGADPLADAQDVGHERGGPARGRRDGPSDSCLAAADAESGRNEDEQKGRSAEGQSLGAVSGTGRGDRLGADPEGVHGGGRSAGIVAWGPYEPAVRRWEDALGRPAPAPVDDRGRLSPPFVEWMMGYPEGWTDQLGRTARLKALGNAVCPQQGAAAVRLLEDAHQAQEVAA